eukprot:COSAG06_NODE_2610_length_6584_cov_12.130301_2_plen_293_part_00
MKSRREFAPRFEQQRAAADAAAKQKYEPKQKIAPDGTAAGRAETVRCEEERTKKLKAEEDRKTVFEKGRELYLEAKMMAANEAAPTSSKTRSSHKPGTADYASRRRQLLQKRMEARSASAQGPTMCWARAHAQLDIRGEGGALAKKTQDIGYRTALCGEAMEAEGEHYAEFTLVATEGGYDLVGVARPTYDPTRHDSEGVGSTADGWMLGCYSGMYCHANDFDKDWASGGPLEVAPGETVGLLLSRGRLSVYRNGSSVGVLCEGLSGSFVWAADLAHAGDAVRILRTAVPGQ